MCVAFPAILIGLDVFCVILCVKRYRLWSPLAHEHDEVKRCKFLL